MLWSIAKHACDARARRWDGKDQEDVVEQEPGEARKETELGRRHGEEKLGRVEEGRRIARGLAACESGFQAAERDGDVLEVQRGRHR